MGPANVKFSADGKILAVASSHGSVHLFDASTGGRPREPLDIDAEATTLAFSPDGRFLAAGGAEGNIPLWDAQTWTLIPAGFSHSHRIRALDFSQDGTRLASVSTLGTVNVWDPTSRLPVKTLAASNWEPSSLSISPDGSLVALSTARSVEVWDIDAPEDIDPRGHGRTVVSYGDLQASSARFSADGERLSAAV